MFNVKINLINPEPPVAPEEHKSKKKKLILGLGLFFILTLLVFLPMVFASRLGNFPGGQIWQGLKSLSLTGDRLLDGEAADRVNILLLGMGGEGHDGAYLTDTIILASLRPSDGKLALLSIPRDLVIFMPGFGWRRVNNVNAFAESVNPDSGGQATAQAISRAFDLPIQYYARLDFAGFRKMIDEVGGVRVYVDKSFTDNLYPTDDFKYQTVGFEQGWQIMDGETALKFTRSRHGSNGENSDFARSRRQQKILTALKDKIFSFETLVRPSRLRKIVENLNQHFNTNLELWQALRLVKLFNEALDQPLAVRVLDDSPNGPLQAIMIDGAYLLEPKNNNWQSLRALAANLLEIPEENGQKTKKADAVVEVQNGTWLPGLANQNAERLKNFGLTVIAVGNAAKRDFAKTTIYDLTNGKKSEALRLIQQELKADVSLSVPAWLRNEDQNTNPLLPQPAAAKNAKVDFIVILGTNAN
ncbi:MAG: LCP family protein [bacterium]|nr:LCP family protein [bacterium]